jgi:hypothetical protein
MIRNNITEVAYSVQTNVDSKNSIPVDYKVTNQNDSKAMGVSYILTKKGMERASSGVGFMFIAYNLQRIGNILAREVLKELLDKLPLAVIVKNGHGQQF